MSILGTLLGGGIKNIGEGFASIVGAFKGKPLGEKEAKEMQLAFEELLDKERSDIEQTIRKELETTERIIVAEMQQGDNYTKRARPSVVYFGLIVIAYNYCVIPTVQAIQGLMLQPFELPTEFWVAWGGVVGVWTIGRSAEKRGTRNRLVSTVTGTPLVGSRLLGD